MDGERGDIRTQLISATISQCIKRGYHHTTVADIAGAVGVSAQKFHAHFTSKDAAIQGVIEHLLHETAAALVEVPADADPVEALMLAHLQMIKKATQVDGLLSVQQVVGLPGIVMAAPDLQVFASQARSRVLGGALTDWMGVRADPRQARLAVTLWSAIAAAAYDHGARHGATAPEAVPDLMVHQLRHIYQIVTGQAPKYVSRI